MFSIFDFKEDCALVGVASPARLTTESSPSSFLDFSGTYSSSDGGTSITISQSGTTFTAAMPGASWSPATGSINGSTVHICFSESRGSLSKGIITWDTGMVWTLKVQTRSVGKAPPSNKTAIQMKSPASSKIVKKPSKVSSHSKELRKPTVPVAPMVVVPSRPSLHTESLPEPISNARPDADFVRVRPVSGMHGGNGVCNLPPMASVRKVHYKANTRCTWMPHAVRYDRLGACEYDLLGDCKEFLDKETGCKFWGISKYEQRVLRDFLPSEAPGEIVLTQAEKRTLLKKVLACNSRPLFFTVAVPPLASEDKPLRIMAGGSPGIDQHFYYTLNEIAGNDMYHLYKQREEEMQLIVDIGANIGLFSIAACKKFPKARIIALEPHPLNFRFATENIALAGCTNVELYNAGLSSHGGDMKIYWHDSIGSSAFRIADEYVHMQTMSPDQLWRVAGNAWRVDLMKIDCEGCEYEVVPLLQQWRILKISCETHGATVSVGKVANMAPHEAERFRAVERSCIEGRPFNNSWAGMPGVEHLSSHLN